MSSAKTTRTILVTGASSGLGKACAEHLAVLGHKVYGTSRNAAFEDASTASFELIPMDVCDDQSVAAAINYVVKKRGAIDVVINNAGIVYSGSIEDLTMDEFRNQLGTNFFGVVRVTKNVLPFMRQQGSGLIVNISSIGGFIGLPFQSAYCASKFAIEGFTESLRMEVKPFGVRALIIQPGDFKTNITDNRRSGQNNTQGSVYFEACKRATDTNIAGEISGTDPQVLANRIAKLIDNPAPAVRYTVGPFLQRLAAKIKYFMPSKLFERIIADEYK